jgi:hypothetical protein
MAIRSRQMHEDGTYWPPNGQDAYGKIQFSAPVAVKLRWQNVNTLFRDTQAREVVSDAVAYVNVQVATGGRLAVGSLVDPEDGKEIRAVHESPSLDGSETLVKAMM